MYEDVLKQIGLNQSEIEIFNALLKLGAMPANKISLETTLNRTNVYNVLASLEKQGLIEQTKKGAKTLFSLLHPSKLKELLEAKQKQIQQAESVLDTVLPQIVSDYNLAISKPGVRFYEGKKGLEKIYDEILNEGKDFYMIRSAYEPVYKEMIIPIIDKFVKNRVKKNIAVTAINPTDVIANPAKDASWLMKRFAVEKEMYTAPVEIDIFGDKVAFLSFGNELIGILIESKQIAQSLVQLFTLASLGSKIKPPKMAPPVYKY